MNKVIPSLFLTASIGLTSGCGRNQIDNLAPQIVFHEEVPTAITYSSNRVNLTLCSNHPGALKMANNSLEGHRELSIPDTTLVCLSSREDTVRAVVLKTRAGWYLSLDNTGSKDIDGSYKFQ